MSKSKRRNKSKGNAGEGSRNVGDGIVRPTASGTKPDSAAPSSSPQASPSKFSSLSLFVEPLAFASIMVLFFASGLSSLIYQVVWTRLAVLVFGATTSATATVVGVFMGGLALGSFMAGRWSPRINRPLLWYGVLEALIGAWAAFTPQMFTFAVPIYRSLWQHAHESSVAFELARIACTSAILLFPTACMGATLPLLSKHITTNIESVGSKVGSLYAVNTFGAIVGALICGFVLLPTLGIISTVSTAAMINALLLTGAVVLSFATGEFARRPQAYSAGWRPPEDSQRWPLRASSFAAQRASGAAMPLPSSSEAAAASPAVPRTVLAALIGIAVSGAIAMIYEVCWTRALLMVVGSSTYAFTIMLVAFLTGIFGGSAICSKYIDKARSPLLWFAAVQIVLGALSFVSMREFNYLPYWNLQLNAGGNFDANQLMFVRFMLAGSVLIPLALCLGATFPIAVKACTKELQAVGRTVGTLYSANTVGAIIGSFVCGFCLIPMFGCQNTLIGSAIANVLLGVALLWFSTETAMSFKWAGTVCGALAALLVTQATGAWNKAALLNAQNERRRLTDGQLTYKTFDDWSKAMNSDLEIKYWKDGACSNVGVVYQHGTKITGLITNGHADASDSSDMPVQSLLAAFPLFLRPDAQDVCVVGWGSGQTVGTASLFPVKHIDAVELEPAVVEGSTYFHHINHIPEKNPIVGLHYNDGRNFLLASDHKYDAILSEPSNPWQAGVCNLFTKEYFNVCHHRLNKDGVLAVWVQTLEVPPRDIRAVVGAMQATFKHVVAFVPLNGNMCFIGSDEPLNFDVQTAQRLMDRSDIAMELRKFGIKTVGDLIGRFSIASDAIAKLVDNAPPNSDDLNTLEYDVAKTYETKRFWEENQKLLSANFGNPWNEVSFGNMPADEKAAIMSDAAEVAVENAGEEVALGWAQRSIALHPTARAYKTAGGIMAQKRDYSKADEDFSKALALAPDNTQVLQLRGSLRVGRGQAELGRKDLQRAWELEPENKVARFLMASSYARDIGGQPYSTADVREKRDIAAHEVLKVLGALPDEKDFYTVHPNVLLIAAQAYYKLGDFQKASLYSDEYCKVSPHSEPGWEIKTRIDQLKSKTKP